MISAPLYRGRRQYRLVVESGGVHNRFGKPICFSGHEDASAFLRKLTRDETNEPRLRRFMHRLAEPRMDIWRAPLSRLCSVLAQRGDLRVVQIRLPWRATKKLRVSGRLTLSHASWHATAALYPSSAHPHHPDKWHPSELSQLLKARAAIHYLAASSQRVDEDGQFSNATERMLKPYHCTENFPHLDLEIGPTVNHFVLSPTAHLPNHPDRPGALLSKTYGPFFYFNQSRDPSSQSAAGTQAAAAPVGDEPTYIHFYRSSTPDNLNASHR